MRTGEDEGEGSGRRRYARERGLDPVAPRDLIVYLLRKREEGRAVSTIRAISAAHVFFTGEEKESGLAVIAKRVAAECARARPPKHRDKASRYGGGAG